jgi:hypothetical protein
LRKKKRKRRKRKREERDLLHRFCMQKDETEPAEGPCVSPRTLVALNELFYRIYRASVPAEMSYCWEEGTRRWKEWEQKGILMH